MKRCILVCAILVLALTTQAYGMGGGHGKAPGPGNDAVYGGGTFATQPPNGTGSQPNCPGHKPPVSVPEPATLLLLGAGLVGLVGLKKKMK